MTKKPLILVKSIRQQDNHTFSIEWSDGKNCSYRLSELQKQCPCAGCVEEGTHKRVIDPSKIQPDVRAVRIVNVGRYALRIQFTHGCSNGIYSFDFLHQIGNN